MKPSVPIILASASAQRRKLLSMTGLSFTVRPSKARELKTIKTTVAALVRHNSLIKAQDIAKTLSKGIVIGSDTVVYGGGKLILKPRTLKEAKKILHELYAKPHAVYSGVALIDAASGRKLVDHEKTKIYMDPLSDEEIDRYHAAISPLDKAGGFDIEGRGGLFINRIEGCYSNVIGLPMSKLRTMLKKFGVSLLSILLCVSLSVGFTGCSTEYNLATGEQETLIYGTDKEVAIGDKVAEQVDKNYKLVHDVELNNRVQKILEDIVAVCDRRDIVYSVKIIDEDVLNAVSLPGGHIYLFKGMLDALATDDQIAGVLAHELGHITARHGIKRLQASYGYTLLQVAAVASGDRDLAYGANTLFTHALLAYSRRDEFQSDELAVKYTKAAGYDPEGMKEVLQIMSDEQAKGPRRQKSYFRTHPYHSERIAVINKEISGKIGFKDYLNLTGQDL